VYTARDAAHRRLVELLEAGQALPVDLRGQVIYYCGPAPTPPGHVIGSAGPTSSYRMDVFTPALHAAGLKATIGKGDRSLEVRQACRQYCAVYLVAVGGAGALLARSVVDAEIAAYEDLGPEALRRLEVVDFPALVAYDAHGGSVFPGDDPLP
jgi:fumarate hydratase subunit beta